MPLYDERLAVPRAWWLAVPGAGLAVGAVLLALAPLAALVGLLAASAVVAGAVHAYGSARIVVTNGALTAGKLTLPVESLGLPEILDKDEAFAWRTRMANPKALMLLRGYVPTAVRIELKDSPDGAPYLYLSTRSPMTLAAVLAFLRG